VLHGREKAHKPRRSHQLECLHSLQQPFGKKEGYSSAKAARTVFWDKISKVPACRSALREFDRRKILSAKSTFIVDDSSGLTDAKRVRTGLEVDSTYLRRFAKRGGPDLRYLRGVSFTS
jgi:hypothetical protein